MLDFLSVLYRPLSLLWEMSVTAAYASAIIIVLRLLLKKRVPKQVMCLLWLVVFARLLIPVSLESPLSIVPGALPGYEQTRSPDKPPGPPADVNPAALNQSQTSAQNPNQNQAVGGTAAPVNSNPAAPVLDLPEGVALSAAPQAPAASPWRAAAAGVWLAGAAAMGAYAMFSYLRLRRRLFDAIRTRDGAWEHPAVHSPFILGMLRPRIYLPAGLAGRPRKFILCHERAHLRRLDHIVKPVCWAALALHWFNPLAWAAFILMSRDMESACDEAVVRRLGSEVKADYSATLLALATGRRVPSPCPLAFDEGDAKGRIQNVLRYRRPALWVIVVSAVMAVMAAVCLLTDPVSAEGPEPENNPDPSPEITAPQVPENHLANTVLDPWMKEVLDGEREFIHDKSYYDDRRYTINDLRSFYYGDDQMLDVVVEAGKLTAIDLDRDGINELVVTPEGDDEYLYSVVGYLILHRIGDEVYGYTPGYRSFYLLKADGTFHWSGSAFNWGTAYMTFNEDSISYHDTTWCLTHAEDGGGDYFVDERRATREEFEAANDAQNAKPEPTWYTYADGVLDVWHEYTGTQLIGMTIPETDTGEAALWKDDGGQFLLEWNGSSTPLDRLAPMEQLHDIACRDFDGDGENEVMVFWQGGGFPQLSLYEWEDNQPALAASYDTRQLLVRFNKNNVAGYNKDSRGLTVTYSHETGPGSIHYVTGHTTLPEDFFDGGYERFKDDAYSAYADTFHMIYLREDLNAYYLDFEFYLADVTMHELAYVDPDPPYSQYADHYMFSKPVGGTGFLLSYDGTGWKLTEADELMMDYQDEDGKTTAIDDIATAAPLDAPLVGQNFPEDPNEWFKVAELPDDMIWMYTRGLDGKVLLRWDGNFYKVFDHLVTSPRGAMPQLKKLGGADTYGPLAVISNVGSGTGVSVDELVVYDLDAPDPVDYTHDWKPLMDDFNNSVTYRYGSDTHTLIYACQGQMVEAVIEADDSTYRRIEQEGITLRVTGSHINYWFDRVNDGNIKIELTIEAFIGDDILPLSVPGGVEWTLRFNGSGFDTVPGSCKLTYPGYSYQ